MCIRDRYSRTDGEVLFKGKDPQKLTGKEKQNYKKSVQMVFQDPYGSLDPRMTVAEIIGEGIDIHHLAKNKKERNERIYQDVYKRQGLAYMTGILPIKKYGSHSALNMFTEYSMTNPREMAGYFGFTEDEVKKLCETYQRSFDETQAWYDGYDLVMFDGCLLYTSR